MISRVEAEKEAEKAVVDAASRGHFLEQQIANLNNYNYKADESFDRGASTEDQEHAGLKPKSKRKKSKAKNAKSKYGYKYDGFIDDSEDIDSDDDWEENSEPKAKKKTKGGRPKKIKEEDEEKTHQPEPNLNSIDPLMKAREDAIERTFHELNEFYSLQSDPAESQMTFNQVRIYKPKMHSMYSICQDDDGVFHCEVQNCIFSTLVLSSISSLDAKNILISLHSCPSYSLSLSVEHQPSST